MKEVGVVKRTRKVRASAVPAVEEWEEGIPATVVETTGESVEKPTEEVLDKNGVQDMEDAVAQVRQCCTDEGGAAPAAEEAAVEEGEETIAEKVAVTAGSDVEELAMEVLDKVGVQDKEDAVLKDRQCYSVEGAEKQYVAFPMLEKIEDFKSKAPINWVGAQGWLCGGP